MYCSTTALPCGIALGGGIKGGAAIYPAALGGYAMQGAFGVGCHGFFGHADQGGGTGQAFQAAGRPQVQRGASGASRITMCPGSAAAPV